MLDPRSLKRPSTALSTVVALIIGAGWIYVRTFLYHDSVLPITYVIPLMVAVWSRRRWQLWTLASLFFAASCIHFILNNSSATTTRDDWTMLLTTLFNVVIGAGVIHGILDMLDNRDLAGAQLANQNEQILRQNHSLESQAEELRQQTEELEQQNEEIRAQAEEVASQHEEIESQSEELARQNDELQDANHRLGNREHLLQSLLDLSREEADEPRIVTELCERALAVLDHAATHIIMLEKEGEEFVLRGAAHTDHRTPLLARHWPVDKSFAEVVLRTGRTAYIDDLDARPDLTLPRPGTDCRSVLATPLARGRASSSGAVLLAYSAEPRHWSDEDFRLLEWLAAQSSMLIDALRHRHALRDNEDRLRLAIAATGLGTFDWTVADRTHNWSKRAKAIFGLTPAAPVDAERFSHCLHPADKERVEQHFYASLDPAGDGTYRDEFRTLWPDGTERWVHARGQVLFAGQGAARRAARFIGTFLDITDRKRHETELAAVHRRLRRFVDSNIVGIAIADAAGRLLEANAYFLGLVGATPADLQSGRLRWTDSTPPEHAAADQAAIIELRQRGVCKPYEKEYVDHGGERIQVLVGATQLPDTDEQIVAFILDISERKQAEQKLELANRAKDHFLAMLSHELRTPLTPVQAAAGVLETDDRLPEDVREDIAMIRRNVAIQARLIDDLLDLTRIARGKLELQRRPINVPDLLRQAAQIVAPELDAKGQRLIVHLDLPDPCQITADPARIQQVIWNLLKNAIKFTPVAGTITVNAVTRCNTDGDGARLYIEVRDSGVGIEADAIGSIFQPFEQASEGKRRGGLGLGLAICKAILEAHGGSIKASSAGRGHGAVFSLEVPWEQTVPMLADNSLAPAGPSRSARGLRVLFVEDHADTARLMSRLLRAEGIDVHHAASVAEALSALGHRAFDLLISDLGLPDGTGLDLMRRARASAPRLPGIALSGFGMESDVQASREAGFSEHLTKPVEFDQLLQTILRLAPGAVPAAKPPASSESRGMLPPA